MEPKVILTKVNKQHVLSDEEYAFLLDNLNKPLPLANIWWNEEGELRHLSIHHRETVIVLFDYNKVEGEFFNGIKFQLG